MKPTEKTHAELFEGLCKVLAENSQGLSEGQEKAIAGFLDVLVESLNKRWGKAVKEFLVQQKLANENQKKKTSERKQEAVRPEQDLSKVLAAVESLKQQVLGKEQDEASAAKAELKVAKAKFAQETAAAVKKEKDRADGLQAECDKVKEQAAERERLLEAANEACQKKIVELTEALKAEKIKNYLESKLTSLPTYEANLLRKRFSTAKSTDAIDREFDSALTNVRERRNAASGEFTTGGRQRPLNVEPNRFSETAKPAQSRVDLLTESNLPQPPSDEDYGEGEDDNLIDTPISQEMMARWMSAVG